MKQSSETPGEAYQKLVKNLTAKGADDPRALAAWIGRKTLGKAEFQERAAAGRRAEKAQNRQNPRGGNASRTIYDYQTGETLGPATASQYRRYLDDADTGISNNAGAVDGTPYGYPGQTIYMI